MKKQKGKKRIIVAMSGGVDSSVSAALLKQGGFEVAGIFMKFWKDGKSSDNRCCSVESEKLARAVANKLEIPFYVLNVEKEFKKKIVDYFLKEYKNGLTPNPCVVCNREIKFGFLIEKALALGADFVATGHYVMTPLTEQIFSRLNPPEGGAHSPRKNFSVRLFMAKDAGKDQTYFLCQLDRKNLGRIIFPVGGYKKPEVRKLAKKFDLPVAESKESQEVCFISGTTEEFLKKYLKTKPGPIIEQAENRAKKVIGRHQGLWFYTIGQRKGIGLSGGPYYVVGKDLKKNALVVSKDKNDLQKKEFVVKNVNWLCDKAPKTAQVKIRYRNKPGLAKIEKISQKNYKIIFKSPQRAVTPGQFAVFYKNGQLLGGGAIK